jgi:AraC-like DNA-binding protein
MLRTSVISRHAATQSGKKTGIHQVLDMGQLSRRPRTKLWVSIPFAQMNAFLPFIGYLDEEGAPTDSWLAEAHMPMRRSEDSDGLVPLTAGYRFLALAVERGGYQDLGVVAAKRASVNKLGAYGALLSRVSSVHEYLRLGARLVTTMANGGARFWLRGEGDYLRVHLHFEGPDALGVAVAEVFTLVLTIETLRQMLGPTWGPVEICLGTGVEDLFGDWLSVQSTRVLTHQTFTSFTLPRSLLNRAVPPNVRPRPINDDLDLKATGLMPDSFLASMEYLVSLLVHEGRADLGNLAEAAGLSCRTLQRKLAQAGTSYRSLLKSASLRMAQQRLSGSSIRVTDIAAELGYTDVSNFARAFQSQVGLSPSEYRAAHRS